MASMDDTVGLYDLNDKLVKQYTGHRNRQMKIETAITKNPNDRRRATVIAGSEENKIYAWDLNTQIPLWQISLS